MLSFLFAVVVVVVVGVFISPPYLQNKLHIFILNCCEGFWFVLFLLFVVVLFFSIEER